MKKLIYILSGIALGTTLLPLALAAPVSNYFNNLLPARDQIYDLGSTTPAAQWKNIYTKNITISGTCTGCPSGGGGADGNWTWWNGSGIRLATSTNQVLAGGSATTTTKQFEVGNLGTAFIPYASSTALTVSGNTYLGSLTGLLKGTSGLVGAATAGVDYENPLTFSWPLIRSTNALSFGGLSTSSAAVIGNIPYFSGVNTFANVATSSLTASSPLSLSQPISVIGLSASVLSISTAGDWTGTFDGQEGSYYLARANHTGTQGVSTLSNYDWTFGDTYGASNITASTSIPLWVKGQLNASSTAHFSDYIDQTAQSAPAAPASGDVRRFITTTSGLENIYWKGSDNIPVRESRDLVSTVKNTSGSTINAGQIVYITGAVGTAPTVSPARANASTTMGAHGVMMQSCTQNSFCRIQRAGRTEFGFDTSAFAINDRLFVSTSTAGALTNVIPSPPDYRQQVGTVVISNAVTGSIFIDLGDTTGDTRGTNYSQFSIDGGGGGARSLLFSNGTGTTTISNTPTAARAITLPDANGTLAVSASGNIALSAAGDITFTGTLPIANGGTNATSFTTSGNGVYYNGTSLLTAPLTSAVTYPYASTTALSVSNSFAVTPLTSALTLTGADGTFAEYTGTTCTNQFVRALSALGVATCATVTSSDVDSSIVPSTRQLTVAGSANQINSSAGAQDLSTDRAWTLSLPNHVIFPNSFFATLASTSQATTTSLHVTSLTAGDCVQAGANGLLTTSGSPCGASGLTLAGSSGQLQFNNGASNLGANANLYWDNTNSRLGIGSTTPYAEFSVGTTSPTGTMLSFSRPDFGEVMKFSLAGGNPTMNIGVPAESTATLNVYGTINANTDLQIGGTAYQNLSPTWTGLHTFNNGTLGIDAQRATTSQLTVGDKSWLGTVLGGDWNANTITVPYGGTGSTGYTNGSVIFSNGTILAENPNQFFWNNSNGRLGLGTTTPYGKLNLAGNGGAPLTLTDNTAGTDAKHWQVLSAVGGYVVRTVNDAGAGANPRMVISPVGNMGIATSTPNNTLNVNGSVYVEDQGTLKLSETRANGGHYFGLSATSSMAADLTMTLPDTGGTIGQILATNGAGNLYWSSAGAGTVTSVDGSGGTTGLTLTGGPITTSGTLTLGGTLIDDNGGTGQSTYATGDMLYASAANTLAKLTLGAGGTILASSGGVPAWVSTSTLLTTLNLTKGNFLVGNDVGVAQATSSVFVSSTGGVGIASTTPFTKLSIGSGSVLVNEYRETATSTTYTLNFNNGNQQLYQHGTAATTISFSNYVKGSNVKFIVCNPNGTAGAITWPANSILKWPGGVTPGQTTTAGNCDVYSFIATEATSTAAAPAVTVFGIQAAGF